MMNPFEDMIPEEQEERFGGLIVLLRQAYHQEQQIPENEQQETIERVAMRLTNMEENKMSRAERGPEEVTGPFLLRSQSRPVKRRSMIRVVSALVAVLVISILSGSAFLLFTQYTHSQGKPALAGPTDKPVTVDTKWNGLEMSMSVTPGPYFLGELLSVDLSLTNRTGQTVELPGISSSYFCVPPPVPFPGQTGDVSPHYSLYGPTPPPEQTAGMNILYSYVLSLEQTGGTSPHYSLYTMPVQPAYSCPAMMAQKTAFAPGETVAGHFYELLASSGDVTVAGKGFLYIPQKNSQGVMVWPYSPTSLVGHLPMLHIHVAPRAPANRIITLQEQGLDVVIHAPIGTQLLSHMYTLCKNSDDRLLPTLNNRDDWEPISTNILHRPGCSENEHTTIMQWNYAIGAVGYAVVQGEYSR